MAVKKKEEVSVATFYKKQLIYSDRYLEYRDVLSVILNDEDTYTLEEVDELIEEFMNKEVH